MSRRNRSYRGAAISRNAGLAGAFSSILLLAFILLAALAPAPADWMGGSDTAGMPDAGRSWYFAEGCSRSGFDTWLCLANPGDDAALLDIDYYCGDGETVTVTGLALGPHSRFTILVHEDGLGVGRHDDFSIELRSVNGVPVVAERPTYVRYRSLQPDWRSVDRTALAEAPGWGEIRNGSASKRTMVLTFDME
ncbi:MAG: hypothetical protein SWK76_01285 [Actinomycetota bacterium]|nr:hypothetical protein [Actinomycetota bacterium]